ncbi:MAG: polysaccharide biosynthesis/export family protein [Kiritimatiellae bacterium]|nr:polysaccharide biosynthesis/export family protein [Kiritimatiellia bacterium]
MSSKDLKTCCAGTGPASAPCRLAVVLLCVALMAVSSGCGLFRGLWTADGASEEASLDGALAGMVPLPFEGSGGKMTAEDEADAAAAAAAAAAAGDSGAHFSSSGDPVLRPGLVVKIAVMVGEKQEIPEARAQISDKGDITLPLVGKVACDGMTLPDLKAKLTRLYDGYMRNPEVSVEFHYDDRSDSPWGKVLVQGRVKGEGWVNMPPTRDMTVSRAIQLAGGFDTSAKKHSILVTRHLPDGKTKQFRVDLMAVGKHGDIDNDIKLEPGDVIYVPESRY